MDLIRSSANAPMSPLPSSRGQVSAAHQTLLVKQLSALSQILGVPTPTKIIPGGIPSVEIAPDKLMDSSMYLRDSLGFDLLSCLSGVDMVDHLEVVYHLRSLAHDGLIQIKVKLPPGSNEIESLIAVWPTANWLERETFDMYGIIFMGHPDLRRILLDDEFEGFPLLKSFRPTPLTAHDRATTQASGEISVSGESERGVGQQRVVSNLLSQGDQERLHPGTPTFGSTQFHGREFPPTTWKHTLEHNAAAEQEAEQKKSEPKK